MKKVTCSYCHGSGKVTCSYCNGRGKIKCPDCKGSGHSCPVCSHGEVKKTRWINCDRCSGKGYRYDGGYQSSCYHCGGRGQIKETYNEICPNCHGDYQNKKYECRVCGGSGTVSCAKTERCFACDGTGKVNVSSKCNLRLFRAFSMAFGFSGLQYAYVGRWFLFVLQLVSFMVFGTVVVYFDPVLSFASRFGIDEDYLRMFRIFMGAIVLVNMVLGMFLVKCDGKGGMLNEKYKRGWFWIFLLLFGLTGAHLAYAANKKETLILCLAYAFVVVFSLSWYPDLLDALRSTLIFEVVPGTFLIMLRNKKT